MSSTPKVTVTIPCHIGWSLLQEFDNSDNHNTTITRKVELKMSKEITGKDFFHTVHESSQEVAQKTNVDISASATWGPASASVSTGFEASKVLKDFVSSTTEVTREEIDTWEQTETVECNIGPGDKLYFYQQVFSGPGIVFALDTTSVTSHKKGPDDDQDVDIVVVSSPIRFIDFLDTVYGDRESDAPEDRVLTLGGGSEDINHSFKGKYVWLQPRWTYDTTAAATSFDIFIQEDPEHAWKDMAAGAGGDYRYVYSNHDQFQARKVIAARLIRSGKHLSQEEQETMLTGLGKGWVAGKRDINENRHGDWLYLAWQLY